MSKAATLPMANPYPLCTSGSATECCTRSNAIRLRTLHKDCVICRLQGMRVPQHAGVEMKRTETIPGRAATLAICFTAGRNPPWSPLWHDT